MVTLKREVPPGWMAMGEKLLFISAGKVKPCACMVCPGAERARINTPINRRAGIDLFMFFLKGPVSIHQKRNRRHAVGFAICSPLPVTTRISDQTKAAD